LAPEIASKLGPLPAETGLAAGEERLRMFDQVARWIRTLGQRRGVMLMLDDLHWADHGTLALLHYLLRQSGDQRVLVLGCYRETELARTHPLAAALVDWNRERLATRLALGRLTRVATGQLLAHLFGQDSASSDFVAAIHKETDGNPFFIEEVIKSLIEQGQIYRGGGEWQRHAVAELTIPQSIKAAVSRRLDRLDASCTEVLHCAAALGKVFAYDELAATCTIDENVLLDALDAAAAAQLVRSEGAESFAFTHDKIREVLHDELNPVRRRRTHLRIAETLEKLHLTDVESHVGDLAYHFIEAGEFRRGLDYSRRAAAAAESVYAHEEAVEWYERARECAEGLEDSAALCDIHARIGSALEKWGRLPESIAAFERAIALAATPTQRGALRSAMGLAMTHASDPRGPEVMAEALRELDPATQAKERAMALTMIGRFHHYRLQHTRALEYFAEARAIAEAAGDLPGLDIAISFTAGAYQHLARYRDSDGWARADIELGESHGYLPAQASGYEFLAENAFGRGDWEDAVRFGERDLEIGRRVGSLSRQTWATLSIGEGKCGLGQLDEAIVMARDSEVLAGRLGETRLQVLLMALGARALMWRGRDDDARETVERAIKLAGSIGQPWISHRASVVLAEMEVGRGDLTAATERLMAMYLEFEHSENRLVDLFGAPLLARCQVLEGRLDEARRLLDRLLPIGVESGARGPWAAMRAAEAELFAALGDRAAAGIAFEEAIATFVDRRSVLHLAQTLIARAGLARSWGDTAAARADLTRARDTAAPCRAEPLIMRATALLAGLGSA
ncbi:MAG: ATP-binding protein, partial [Candidatus Eisenbacteria bacterium]